MDRVLIAAVECERDCDRSCGGNRYDSGHCRCTRFVVDRRTACATRSDQQRRYEATAAFLLDAMLKFGLPNVALPGDPVEIVGDPYDQQVALWVVSPA